MALAPGLGWALGRMMVQAGWRGPPCHSTACSGCSLAPRPHCPAGLQPSQSPAQQQNLPAPYEPRENLTWGISRERERGCADSPVDHLSMLASPWPEILLKGVAEESGGFMQEGRCFYFGKAQPCLSLCAGLCRARVPTVPSRSRDGEGRGQRCPLSTGEAAPLFLPLLRNQLELFHVMASAPAKSAWGK